MRRKLFTIQEGHYTGPKDLEDGIPGAFGTVTKTTLAGIGIGGVAGKLIEDNFKKGAKLGGKTGFVAGILIKVLLNSLHNPMTSVKYQEVDKQIRSSFGINRVSGFTFGDSKENRIKLDESFAFNDRYIHDYKIIIAIQNNQVTLYTQNISDSELRRVSDTLDYYCKKYYGMDYNSKILSSRNNSYSVSITFTNYSIISDFLIELADVLKTKINILDNKAIVEDRIGNEENEIKISTPKFFSKTLDKYELLRILGNNGEKVVKSFFGQGNIISVIMESLVAATDKLTPNELAFITNYKDLNNDYLLFLIKNKLRLIDGIHYTVGQNKGNTNIKLHNGILFITVQNNSKDNESLKKIGKYFTITKHGEVNILAYKVRSKPELEVVVSKLFSTGIIPNIFCTIL